MVSNRFAPSRGGVETYVGRISHHLAATGTRVHIVTHRLTPDQPDYETLESGATVRRVDPLIRHEHARCAPSVAFHVRRAARHFDVLHAHSLHDPVTAIAMAAWRGPTVLNTYYHGGSDHPGRDVAHRAITPVLRTMVDAADRVIALTSAEAAEDATLTRRPRQFANKVTVIGSGIDVDAIRDAPPVRTASHQQVQVVVPGRLVGYKHIDRIVHAVGQLGDTHRLSIVGDGPELAHLRDLVTALGFEDTVDFVVAPSDDAMRSRIRGADVICSASAAESQGIIPLEGIAAGATVAMSDIPAHLEIHRRFPDQTMVFGLGDSDAQLAARLRSLRAPRSDRTAAAAHLQGWAQTAERISTVHQQVVAHHAGSPMSARARSRRDRRPTLEIGLAP